MSWAGDGAVMTYLHDNVDPLFSTYNVSIHYSGHTHVTQRHCASARGACLQNSTLGVDGVNQYYAPPATVYFTLGNAGANADRAFTWGSTFTAWQSSAFAYASVTVANRTHLEVRIADAATGVVLDTSRIVVPRQATPAGGSGSSSGATGAAASVTVAGAAVLLTAWLARRA
jgi:hypothetical protein